MTALFYDNDKGQERQFISEQWVILIIQYLLTMKSERKYIYQETFKNELERLYDCRRSIKIDILGN